MVRENPSSLAHQLAAAGLGAVVGLLLGGVGLVLARAFLRAAEILGPPESRDLPMLVLCVGVLALGGAHFGAVRLAFREHRGMYVGCLLAGVVLMLGIARIDKGSFGVLHPADWVALPLIGVVIGVQVARGLTANVGESATQ